MTKTEIQDHIKRLQNGRAATNDAHQLELIDLGLAKYRKMLSDLDQKKSQSADPTPKESNRQEFFKKQAQEYRESGRNDLADKVEQEVQNMHRDQMESEKAFDQRVEWEKREGFQTTYTAPQPQIKTVKAPDFEDDYADLINVTLTNSKGDKFVRTHTKAQVKANCRKYFANVLQTRINGNDKLGVGFKNLLAYFVAWMELNQVAPELKDVLQDYSKYKRGDEKQEPSEAFKIAQQLYAKLISLTTKKEKAEGG